MKNCFVCGRVIGYDPNNFKINECRKCRRARLVEGGRIQKAIRLGKEPVVHPLKINRGKRGLK